MHLLGRTAMLAICWQGLVFAQTGEIDDGSESLAVNDAPDIQAAIRFARSQDLTAKARVVLSGKVVLADGEELPATVLIQRVCSDRQIVAEGYADRKGRFSVQLGEGTKPMSDASSEAPAGTTANVDSMSDCQLRAQLPGYRSSSISLVGMRAASDGNDVGTLILTPLETSAGHFFSATSGLASKEARQAFERGAENLTKKKFGPAEKDLRKAVTLQPKYADAWLALGKTYAASSRPVEARDALLQAVASDPNYVYPYEQLFRLAFVRGDWQELAAYTERVMRMDPAEFPDAYYFNGVAHFQMRNLDTAQQSLLRAIEADPASPKARYVLGLVMVGKKDLRAAADNLEAFTRMAPADPQVAKARAVLVEIAKAVRTPER